MPPSPTSLSRAAYADMFGPKTSDRLRLDDAELFAEIENKLLHIICIRSDAKAMA